MYAPDAPRSLINYRDLRANDIHVSTAVENDEEVLELRRGPRRLATAHVAANGLYELCIMQASPPSTCEEEAGAHRHECHPCLSLGGAQACFLAASAKANIWHRRSGHPRTTMMRKMIPILIGHNLCTSDAEHAQRAFKGSSSGSHHSGSSRLKCHRHCIISTAIGAAPSLPS